MFNSDFIGIITGTLDVVKDIFKYKDELVARNFEALDRYKISLKQLKLLCPQVHL